MTVQYPLPTSPVQAAPVFLTDGSGNVLGGANASVSATGAAIPASATYVGGLNAGNLVGLAVDASGRLSVLGIINALPTGANTIGTVTVGNANANGQALSSESSPVVMASDQSPMKGKGDFTEIAVAGPGTVNGLNTDLIPSTDVSAYKWLSLHITGSFALTYTFQCSNDGVNFVSITLYNNANPGYYNGSSYSTATNIVWTGPIIFRYLRIRVTTFTSNASLAGILELYTYPANSTITNLLVYPGNLANTTPWLFAGANANATAAANAGTGNAIKASAGALWSVIVTALGIAAMTFYDNAAAASGTILLSIPANAAVGTIYNFPGGAPAVNGIYADQLASAPNVTISYR